MAKGSAITHAKCAYSFAYNVINLNYEELGYFHKSNYNYHENNNSNNPNFIMNEEDSDIIMDDYLDDSRNTISQKSNEKILFNNSLFFSFAI